MYQLFLLEFIHSFVTLKVPVFKIFLFFLVGVCWGWSWNWNSCRFRQNYEILFETAVKKFALKTFPCSESSWNFDFQLVHKITFLLHWKIKLCCLDAISRTIYLWYYLEQLLPTQFQLFLTFWSLQIWGILN